MRQTWSDHGSGWAKGRALKAMLATFKAFRFDLGRLLQVPHPFWEISGRNTLYNRVPDKSTVLWLCAVAVR